MSINNMKKIKLIIKALAVYATLGIHGYAMAVNASTDDATSFSPKKGKDTDGSSQVIKCPQPQLKISHLDPFSVSGTETCTIENFQKNYKQKYINNCTGTSKICIVSPTGDSKHPVKVNFGNKVVIRPNSSSLYGTTETIDSNNPTKQQATTKCQVELVQVMRSSCDNNSESLTTKKDSLNDY